MANFYIRDLDAIFIHIPKNGGTSIRKGVFKDVLGPLYGHIPDQWVNCFKFSFVRHPIDRFVSAYNMFKYGTRDENGVTRLKCNEPFSLERAFTAVNNQQLCFGQDRKTVDEKFLHHILPMHHPFNCIEKADFVGRFETIEKDFQTILQILDIQKDYRLPRLHISNRKEEKLVFSKQQFEILSSFYADDFEFSGYSVKSIDDSWVVL